MEKIMTMDDYGSEDVNIFWGIAQHMIADLRLGDVGLIEEISIHLEGKMVEILNDVKSRNISPQESYEALQELIWLEVKPLIPVE